MCIVFFFSDCLCINIPDQEIDNQNSETTPSSRFHIYHIIARCTAHGRILFKDTNICYICKQESSSDEYTNIYTIKELFIMETTISYFRTSFYIPDIQKLAFHLPHVCILDTNHCGDIRRTSFKQSELFQDLICCRDYSERVVARFSHQMQSEYYGRNISVYM